jgi:hypothetical protein
MKLKTIFTCLTAVLLSASGAFAGTTLAKWTFEASQPGVVDGPASPGAGVYITNILAEAGAQANNATATASGKHASASTAYSTPVGNGSSHSFSANNWAVGDFYQFAVSTVGAQSIVVTYDHIGSATGPGRFNFAYSTDGINFTNFGSTYNVITNTGSTTWGSSTPITQSSYTNDLSSISVLTNNPVVYFRLVDASTTAVNGGTTASGGTSRIDNFAVSGSTGTPPTISGVSPSSLTTNAGNNVSFTVSLSGGDSPLTYFWYKGTVSPANLIASATTATLTLTNVLLADAANYQVVVSNAVATATSSVVTLSVTDPGINTQPASQAALLNGAVQFNVSAAGTGTLGYQWYYSDSGGNLTTVGTGTPGYSSSFISGAQTKTLTITNLQTTDPTNFVVVVTGSNGSVTSSVASLTAVGSSGQLAFWNFNGALNPTNPLPYQGIGTALASDCNGFAQTTGTGLDSNDYPPLGGANFSWGTSNYPAASVSNKQAGVQFNLSTVNAKDITLSFDVRGTTTASKYFRLQFTTNGTGWIDYPSSDLIPASDASTYESRSYSLVGFPNVANNPNFGVRIVTEFESTALYGATNDADYVGVTNAYASGGTLSYDLVTFNANAITGGTYAPPTIAPIANITIPDNASSNITLTVSGDTVSITPHSLKQSVLSDPSVSGSTLTLTPSGVDGVAPVLVTVVNASGDSAATWFNVTTVPANLPPTITGLANTNTLVNTTLTIPFKLGDDHTDMSTATPTALSGNSTVVSNDTAHLSFGGSGTNRTLIITPVANQSGAVPISVSVSDGTLTTTQTLILEVRQSTNIVLIDNFNYDGSGALTAQSAGFWQLHSGTANQLQAGSGLITVDGVHNSEDDNAPLIGAPYPTNTSGALYARFVINYSTLPNATGAYFAHFKDATNDYVCRVWASSNSPTTYQIGIGNSSQSSATTAPLAQSLSPNVSYTVVTRLVLSNGVSTVWVNPASESSPGATDSTTVTNPVSVSAYAFREDAAEQGILTVSNLAIGTSFNSVIFPPQANPDAYSVAKNSSNNLFSPLTNDVSGGTLALVSASATSGTAAISGTNVLYTPNNGFTGTDTIAYTITDNLGGTNSSTITVTVTNVAPSTIVPTIPPAITSFSLTGGNLVITGTNAQATGVYYLLSSTNVALPLSQWAPVSTNVVSTSNGFTFTGTNVVIPGSAGQFYILSSTNFR